MTEQNALTVLFIVLFFLLGYWCADLLDYMDRVDMAVPILVWKGKEF